MAFTSISGLGAWAWEATLMDKWRDAWTISWANFYEKMQYGDIPMPAAPPAPPAPQTEEELSAWTPERLEAAYGPAWTQWAQSQRAAIAEAEREGTYTPQGSFPGTYTAWESTVAGLKSTLGSNWYLWVGGAVVVGFLLLSRKGRY